MVSANVHEVLKRAQALSLEERQQLLEVLRGQAANEPPVIPSDQFAAALAKKGIFLTVPPAPTAEVLARFRTWRPIEMTGDSLSDELIRGSALNPMAQHFLDSSALLKRYRREIGSQWMLELVRTSERVIVARLAQVEVTAAVVRRGREPGNTAEQVAGAVATLDREMQEIFGVLEFGDTVIDRAIALVRAHALRAADAIQLASALLSREALPTPADLVLVSADDELNAAARAEGMPVENPNLHP